MICRHRNLAEMNHPACDRSGTAARRPWCAKGRGGFTLVELIFVIAIISILVSITSVSLVSAKEKARQADCMSNLRNLGVAIVTYRGDHGGSNPSWTSRLYPSYIDDLSVYVCRSDPKKGHGPVNDPANPKFPETADNKEESTESREDSDGDLGTQNSDVEANSYFYEFSNAECEWSVPGVSGSATWAQFKEYELREGNGGKPHSSSRMPIVRCYHHSVRTKIDAYAQGSKIDGWEMPNRNRIIRSGMTLNVAYAGNVVIAPLWWQGAIHAGEHGR